MYPYIIQFIIYYTLYHILYIVLSYLYNILTYIIYTQLPNLTNLNIILTILFTLFHFVSHFSLSLLRQYKPIDSFIMYTLTETILPVLFTCLVAYFIGSVARLFIHLLISENANS